MNVLLDESQGNHEAMSDTIGCMKIANEGAKRLGFENFKQFLKQNPENIRKNVY